MSSPENCFAYALRASSAMLLVLEFSMSSSLARSRVAQTMCSPALVSFVPSSDSAELVIVRLEAPFA